MRIARWIIGGIFVLFALVNGFHYSGLFLLGAAFLAFPFSFSVEFCKKQNIKASIVVVLTIVLFLAGVITSPMSEPTEEPVGGTTQTTSGLNDGVTTPAVTTTIKPTVTTSRPAVTTTKPPVTTVPPVTTTVMPVVTTTAKPIVTTSPDENVEMVWITSGGKKYHSKSSCSGMISPSEVSIEYAEQHGYTACSKCH